MHEYTIKDHLGNARVTYSDANNDGIVTVSDIKQINSYYPFGMNMEGNFNGAVGSNKYQFNGKELNDNFSLGWNDYGRRFYDATIGRFATKDRLTDTFPNLTPYQYADNNPISKYDFKGDSIIILNAPSGANGAGHAAVLIGSEKSGWNLYSKNGTHGSSGTKGASNKEPQNGVSVGKLADFQKNGDSHGNKYTEGYLLNSDSKKDKEMAKSASAQVSKDYDLLNASCIDVCTDALEKGGFSGGRIDVNAKIDNVPIKVNTMSPTPNGRYQDIKNNNPNGTAIPIKMK